MSAPDRPRSVLRSIWAVLAGLLVVVVLSTAMDALMHGIGVFPPEGRPMAGGLFVLATAYRALFQVAGGFLTAWLAPRLPLRHVWVLAWIGFAAALGGVAMSWNAGPEFGPRWYPIGLFVLAIPTVWYGGRLYLSRAARDTTA